MLGSIIEGVRITNRTSGFDTNVTRELTEMYYSDVLESMRQHNELYPNIFPSIETHMAIAKAVYDKLYIYYQQNRTPAIKRELINIIEGKWVFSSGLHPIDHWNKKYTTNEIESHRRHWRFYNATGQARYSAHTKRLTDYHYRSMEEKTERNRDPHDPFLDTIKQEVIDAYLERGYIFRYFGFVSVENPLVLAKMGKIELNKDNFQLGALYDDKEISVMKEKIEKGYGVSLYGLDIPFKHKSNYLGWSKESLLNAIRNVGLLTNSTPDLIKKHGIEGRSTRKPQILLQDIGIYKKGVVQGVQNSPYYTHIYYETIYKNATEVKPDIKFYISRGDLNKIKELLDEGLDGEQMYEAFKYAIEDGNIDVLNLLLANTDITARNLYYTSIDLLYMVFDEHGLNRPDLIKSLINAGADLNFIINMDSSPLSIAIEGNDIDLAKFLLEAGADPNFVLGNNNTALFTTTNPDAIKLLLEYGANINHFNSSGLTILHGAIIQKNSDLIRFLVENGADVNIDTNYYPVLQTALQVLLNYDDLKFLLEAGAKPTDATMLRALLNGNLNVLKLLLEYGGTPFIPEERCFSEECSKLLTKWQWKAIEENVKKISKQYSTGAKNFKLPFEIWELILLRNRQQIYCRDLNTDKYKYVLGYFAEYLEIPLDNVTTKAQLCKLISKQLSFGGKYGEKAQKYFDTVKGRKRIIKTAVGLGINPSQPLDRILEQIADKIRL